MSAKLSSPRELKKVGHPRSLVIADNQGIREALTYMLKANSFEVVGVETVQRAMATIKDESFDLILVDLINDTLREGLAAGRRIRRRAGRHDVPIIVITFNDMRGASADDLNIGKNEYVVPEIDLELLAPLLRSIFPHAA